MIEIVHCLDRYVIEGVYFKEIAWNEFSHFCLVISKQGKLEHLYTLLSGALLIRTKLTCVCCLQINTSMCKTICKKKTYYTYKCRDYANHNHMCFPSTFPPKHVCKISFCISPMDDLHTLNIVLYSEISMQTLTSTSVSYVYNVRYMFN